MPWTGVTPLLLLTRAVLQLCPGLPELAAALALLLPQPWNIVVVSTFTSRISYIFHTWYLPSLSTVSSVHWIFFLFFFRRSLTVVPVSCSLLSWTVVTLVKVAITSGVLLSCTIVSEVCSLCNVLKYLVWLTVVIFIQADLFFEWQRHCKTSFGCTNIREGLHKIMAFHI